MEFWTDLRGKLMEVVMDRRHIIVLFLTKVCCYFISKPCYFYEAYEDMGSL